MENIAAPLKEIINNDIAEQVIAGIILMSLPVLIKKIKESSRNLNSVLRDPVKITVCFFLSLGVLTLFFVFPNMRNKEEAKSVSSIAKVAPPHDLLPNTVDAPMPDAVVSAPAAPALASASQETAPVPAVPDLISAPQKEQITVRLFGTEKAFSGDITIHIDSIIDKPVNTGTSTQLREYAVTGWISLNDFSNGTKKEIPDFRAGDSVKLGNFTIQMTKVPGNEHAEFSIQKYN